MQKMLTIVLESTRGVEKQLRAEMEKLAQVQEQVSLQLAEAAKLEKAAEENTYDNVKAKALEYAERKKALDIMQAEMGVRDEEIIQLQKLQAVVERRAVQRRIDQADDATDLKTLKEIRDQLKRQVEAIEDETKAKHESHQMDEVIRKSREKRIAQMKTERSQRLAQAKAEEALAQQRLAQESQLRQLQIQYTLEGDAQLLALARERYDTGLQLAKDDATKRAIVETQYRLEVRKIQEAELDRDVAALDARLAKEKEAAQALRDFRFETAEFDASMIEDQSERDLALLQVKYDRELALAEDNQMKRTELQRRYGLERAALEKKESLQWMELTKKALDDYGKGFAEASVGALMFGESFKKSIDEVLKSVAREAGVQALMELAKGTAALAFGSPTAYTHFKSAALFGGVAALAKGGSKASASSAGGGATGTASPSGSALSAPAPQRQSS
jgi:predicted fused transcriptional regulator/phosphomethylpyrimidine kinase